jgi:hypothetical protein
MNDSLDLGIGGVSIPPGTHICAFLRAVPERDAIMVPSLLDGRVAIGESGSTGRATGSISPQTPRPT